MIKRLAQIPSKLQKFGPKIVFSLSSAQAPSAVLASWWLILTRLSLSPRSANTSYVSRADNPLHQFTLKNYGSAPQYVPSYMTLIDKFLFPHSAKRLQNTTYHTARNSFFTRTAKIWRSWFLRDDVCEHRSRRRLYGSCVWISKQ